MRRFHGRQRNIALLLRLLDAAFDIANRVRVFVDFVLVLRPEFLLQTRKLFVDRIEDALMLLHPRFASRPVRAARIAEEALENGPRVVFHRQRLRRAAPRQRMRINAAQVARAGAGIGGGIHGQFERRHLCLFAEMTREQLVDRHVRENLDFIAAAARRSGQKRSRRAGMNVVPAGVKTGQDDHLIPVRGQRLQDR